MVKSYLKFEHSSTFGQISTPSCNCLWLPDTQTNASARSTGGGQAIAGANEDVLLWDIKKGEILSRWSDKSNTAQATVICQSHADNDIFAIGYEDGRIRLWDFRTATVIVTFNGHKSAVTQLAFDESGVRLGSGAKDTDIIVWDLVGEVGLFKLRGHKDQITSLNFIHAASRDERRNGGYDEQNGSATSDPPEYILSTSKDALMKIWDLSSQHCVETHVVQNNGECWALGLSPDHSGCLTAGNDGELRAWSIDPRGLDLVSQDSINGQKPRVIRERGSFYRHGKDRTTSIKFHPRLDFVAIHGAEKAIELWRIRSESEIRKSLLRKKKRRRDKNNELNEDKHMNDAEDNDLTDISSALITEVFVPYVIVRTGGRVRSIDWAGSKSGKSFSVLAASSNNQLEVFNVTGGESVRVKSGDTPDYSRSLSVDMPGHRSDIRCLTLSSDDRMLASASQGALRIWNVRTKSCIRTLDCGYALCVAFLPGDKIVVVGTKEGTLEIFDIASSILLDTLSAHERDIWSLQVHPDGKSLITGSADKTAKFWEFKVVQEEILGTTRKSSKLTLTHTRTLRVSDDILSVRYSPDSRLLAVSTLDNTVKVFFADTLKLYLTLYGHKLPVLDMDISYDNKLIVTCSADKNVRVWGLDFGDCHKAFFAHQDSIMSVAFIPNNTEDNGHHFFSVSKDQVIKYFDGDKFEQIQKLNGHHGEIWALAVAHSGDFIISASHDKSMRVWSQTDEQIFLEEEREKELEDLYENTLLTSLDQDERNAEDQGSQSEVTAAGKQTVETLMAGEKIAEALEVGLEDFELMREHKRQNQNNPNVASPQRNLIFLAHNNISASAYVLQSIERIPSASLHDALLVLSFSQLPALLTFLSLWAAGGMNISLTCRVLFFMLKTHHKQIVSSRLMRPLLEEVRDRLRGTLQAQKREVGFNLAGLKILGRKAEETGDKDYVDLDAWERENDRDATRGKKRAFVNVA
ncbi:MAG: hypothetical protein Q9227_008528 [Pyrenula ochraceoflavens]